MEFIGLQMFVTLKEPPAKYKGTISEVVAGTFLTLSNVWRVDNNEWQPRLTVHASNIVDIHEVPPVPPATNIAVPVAAPATVPVTAGPTALRASPPPHQAKPVFTDPAIMSVGRKPVARNQPPVAHAQPNISEKREPPAGAVPHSLPRVLPPNVVPPVAIPEAMLSASGEGLSLRPVPPPSTVQAKEEEIILPEASTQGLPDSSQRRRKRGGRRVKNGVPDDTEGSAPPNRTKPSGQGKGWRQTPMLQSTQAFQPFTLLKRKGNKGKGVDENGWASEDVTDVQEAGDFDFESGLIKFDKNNLFEQMRKDDQIDDADRLVSHNRQQRPRPGTNGGKNLHASENVLDAPSPTGKNKPSKETGNDFWNSEADDGVLKGGETLSGRDQGSRQGSRRGDGRMSATRRSQSQKTNTPALGQAPARVNPGVSNRPLTTKISRPSSGLSTTVMEKKKQPNGNASAQGLYLVPSDRRVETVSALQMLNLENIAHNEVGLTEEMMTENAGRGIAEVTMTALADPAITVRQAVAADTVSGTTPPPTVVILAGNNKSGIRAVAAGRHLLNKGISVLVCVVGIERNERELLEYMRQQVRLFRNMGGCLFSKTALFDHLRKTSIPTLTIDTPRTALSSLANPSPVTIIIDALLGLAISFEELRTGDQATCYELIEWANRNEAFVLAIDVPTGIDPSSGKVSIVDGNQLYVKPRYVVCVGAPKRGLLEAIIAGEQDDAEIVSSNAALTDDAATDWKLSVVDIGLGLAVWKKAGTKIRRGIDFGREWVVEMRYQGAAGDDDDDMLV